MKTMRARSLLIVLLGFTLACTGSQQAHAASFDRTLSVGSRGEDVLALQKLLNQDPSTRIRGSSSGSLGQETDYFGSLTRDAVARFQEKYADEVLLPAGLSQGTGLVGSYTRNKLNSLSTQAISTPTTLQTATTTPAATTPYDSYVVKDSEKIDIYAGDAKIANVQSRILATINSAITSQNTAEITIPTLMTTDTPSVIIQQLSANHGFPGTKISITGTGILANSVVYFGSKYIVRALDRDLSGTFSFVVPPLPPKRYDLAIVTSGSVSNTQSFVVTNPRNPTVHIESVSPTTIPYDETLTVTGSGFTLENNTVVTTYQTFKGVPSPDGKTLTVRLAPETLREAARVGNKTKSAPMSLHVVNDYGFSDSEKSFTMTL